MVDALTEELTGGDETSAEESEKQGRQDQERRRKHGRRGRERRDTELESETGTIEDSLLEDLLEMGEKVDQASGKKRSKKGCHDTQEKDGKRRMKEHGHSERQRHHGTNKEKHPNGKNIETSEHTSKMKKINKELKSLEGIVESILDRLGDTRETDEASKQPTAHVMDQEGNR